MCILWNFIGRHGRKKEFLVMVEYESLGIARKISRIILAEKRLEPFSRSTEEPCRVPCGL